jgi:hypothetical protein
MSALRTWQCPDRFRLTAVRPPACGVIRMRVGSITVDLDME